MIRASIDEVEEAGAAVELGKEDGGVGLGFRGLDPVKTRLDAAFFTAAFPENPASIAAHPHDEWLRLSLSEPEFLVGLLIMEDLVWLRCA